MYDRTEDLLREIQAGEDSFLDFKEVVFKGTEVRFAKGEGKASVELAKDLSCFANTEGGAILFGVRDDGERVGIPPESASHLQQFIVNVSQHNVEPPLGHLLTLDRVSIPDSRGTPRLCLKVEIKKAVYSVHAPLGRRPYYRLADQCQEMSLEQQARCFERRGMLVPFEERPVYRAGLEEMDRERLRKHYERQYGHSLDEAQIPLDRLLQNLKLAAADETGALHPTALGLLLFSSQPDRHITGAYVDVAAYEGTEPDAARQRDTKAFHGTLVEQIERTLEYLRASPFVPVAATKDGMGRKDIPAYSLRALQEAVVNALVHRDYSIQGAQMRVFLFGDRIEVSNPGKLHNTLTPGDLFAGCQPVRRNQMLAGFLRHFQSPLTGVAYMEGRGEGFLTMVRECERTSGRKPDLKVVGDSVRLTIFAAPAAAPGGVGVRER